MFCKWCGNTIKTTDKKCSSCGRETPPLSDCGGFYDLKRPWEGAPLPQDSSSPVFTEGPAGPNPELIRLREENKAIRNEANDRHRLMLIICGVLGVALLVVLILYIVAVSGDDPAPQHVPQGGGQTISTAAPTGTTGPGNTETSVPTESTATEPSEPQNTPLEVLIQYDKEAETTVANADGAHVAASPVNADETGLNLLITLPDPTDAEDSDDIDLPVNIPGIGRPEKPVDPDEDEPETLNEETIELHIRWRITEDYDEKYIGIASCNTQNVLGFAAKDQTTSAFTWEWAGEDGAYVNVSDGDSDDKKLMLDSLEKEDEKAESTDSFQLRCRITVTNGNGEKLELVLSGFQLKKDGDAYEISFDELENSENT